MKFIMMKAFLYGKKNGNKGLCVLSEIRGRGVEGEWSGGFYILCRFVLAMVESHQTTRSLARSYLIIIKY